MSTAHQAVIVAEANLRQAKEAHAKEQRAENRLQLKNAIALGRKAKDAYEDLRRQFKSAEDDVRLKRGDVEAWNVHITEHLQAKPSIMDLPTEKEERSWQEFLNGLTATRDQAVTELRNARSDCEWLRQKAMEAAQSYQHQLQVVQNARNRVEDPTGFPAWGAGGAARV